MVSRVSLWSKCHQSKVLKQQVACNLRTWCHIISEENKTVREGQVDKVFLKSRRNPVHNKQKSTRQGKNDKNDKQVAMSKALKKNVLKQLMTYYEWRATLINWVNWYLSTKMMMLLKTESEDQQSYYNCSKFHGNSLNSWWDFSVNWTDWQSHLPVTLVNANQTQCHTMSLHPPSQLLS